MTAAARTGPPTNESPPLGEGGPGTAIDVDLDIRKIAEGPRNRKAVDRAKLALCRDALHEAVHATAVYCDVVSTALDLGDDTIAIIALGRLREAVIVACQAGREILALRSEGANQ